MLLGCVEYFILFFFKFEKLKKWWGEALFFEHFFLSFFFFSDILIIHMVNFLNGVPNLSETSLFLFSLPLLFRMYNFY